MTNWTFISKNGKDSFINQFASGCNAIPTNSSVFDYNANNNPLVFRSILKKSIINKCWNDNRIFYYMDTGYFGNEKTASNPFGNKIWHRIVKNNLQHSSIIDRPADRWNKHNKSFVQWKKTGTSILLALPDEKPCKFYGIDLNQWTALTIAEIKKHTDRPIIVRARPELRTDRLTVNTLQQALADDVFALVTYNSNSAIESIFAGIPAFTLSPIHAASPVTLQNLSCIESPLYADSDLLFKWACHLSYGQFHISEIRSGKAKTLLEDHFNESTYS